MKTRFHQQLLIDNQLKKLNTATLIINRKIVIVINIDRKDSV
jgi:hypothetical protein